MLVKQVLKQEKLERKTSPPLVRQKRLEVDITGTERLPYVWIQWYYLLWAFVLLYSCNFADQIVAWSQTYGGPILSCYNQPPEESGSPYTKSSINGTPENKTDHSVSTKSAMPLVVTPKAVWLACCKVERHRGGGMEGWLPAKRRVNMRGPMTGDCNQINEPYEKSEGRVFV